MSETLKNDEDDDAWPCNEEYIWIPRRSDWKLHTDLIVPSEGIIERRKLILMMLLILRGFLPSYWEGKNRIKTGEDRTKDKY